VVVDCGEGGFDRGFICDVAFDGGDAFWGGTAECGF